MFHMRRMRAAPHSPPGGADEDGGDDHKRARAYVEFESHDVQQAVAHDRGQVVREQLLGAAGEAAEVGEHAAEHLLHHVAGAESRGQPRPVDAQVLGERGMHLPFDARIEPFEQQGEGCLVAVAGGGEQEREVGPVGIRRSRWGWHRLVHRTSSLVWAFGGAPAARSRRIRGKCEVDGLGRVCGGARSPSAHRHGSRSAQESHATGALPRLRTAAATPIRRGRSADGRRARAIRRTTKV